MSIVIALLIFSVLVIFHEFGHFIVAKKNGVVVEEFSVGMGPRLFSFERGGTRYSLKALPLGGSCAMLGEDEDVNVEGSFNSKSVWARMAIVFAGPFFNFILAWIFALILIGYNGIDLSRVTVISENTPGYEAGLREGDYILELNGEQAVIARQIGFEQYIHPLDGSDIKVKYKRDGKVYITSFAPRKKYAMGFSYSSLKNNVEITVENEGAMYKAGARTGDVIISMDGNDVESGTDFAKYINQNPWDGKERAVTVKRDGEEINLTLKPTEQYSFDWGFYYNQYAEKQGVVDTVKYSFYEVKFGIDTVIKSLGMLVMGKVSLKEMSGPVGIVKVIGDQYQETKSEGIMVTIMSLLNIGILLSANLGVMNLLPIPALDGGRLLFYIVEVIRRKPLNREKEGYVHFAGFVLLMVLMVVLFINDIINLI